VVPGERALTWLCDSEVARLVVPLGLGRSVRTVSSGQRRVLLVRDGGCAVPLCDRPPGWCGAHHVRWWDKGGATAITTGGYTRERWRSG
jgi:hypothetical protein